MKALKNRSYIVAILVIIFIGVAGGFTKTEYGWWVDGVEECSIPNINPFMPQDILMKECDTVGGVWEKGEKYFLVIDKVNENTPHQTKFDPQSTALFVIAGVIITLVGLEMRKKK